MVSDVQTPLRSPKRPFLSFSRLRGSEGKLKALNWASLPPRNHRLASEESVFLNRNEELVSDFKVQK
ncbi:hypothetical protein MUK42_35276 [Musa troglodytarum]|uniref:Uncharacterized protein n=1 Tax=Musa troglodytarum TaxID=320322 RepID=A0A9E7JBQ1_9LILI|nr:hypothetical protein MUK42_35276 [Musa troglodytarum]